MKNIYSTRLYRILVSFSNLVVANLMFIIGAIPILTIGVSARALYFVCIHMEEGECSVPHLFWAKFFEHFRCIFMCSTLFAVTFLILIADLIIIFQLWRPSFTQILVIMLLSAGIVLLSTASYLFPLLAIMDTKICYTLFSAFILSMRFLPITIIICVLNIIPVALAALFPNILHAVLPIWLFIGFSLTAHINTHLLQSAFTDINTVQVA